MAADEVLFTADHEGCHFEIQEGQGEGFYIWRFVGDSDISTHDHLQDDLPTAKRDAYEEWGVPESAWKPVRPGQRVRAAFPKMGIDSATGIISFESPEFSLGPKTTRTEFLASQVGQQSRTCVDNEPWHSWYLPRMRSGREFFVTAYFKGERLMMVHLVDADERFGKEWKDVTTETLQAQMDAHDEWLQNHCHIQQGRHKWGSVRSCLDPKAGMALIVVKYEFNGVK